MSHCATETTLKPKRSHFMPKTVIRNVFVAQMYWEAVPNTWPGGSEVSVAECVVTCAGNSARYVGGRVEPTTIGVIFLAWVSCQRHFSSQTKSAVILIEHA